MKAKKPRAGAQQGMTSSGWTKPLIRTFRSAAQLKEEAPELYRVLEESGMVVDGHFSSDPATNGSPT